MSYIMTNQYVFDYGKVIDTFNYINVNDIDGEYIGHLIQFDSTVYEVIIHQSGGTLNPNDDARIVSENIDVIYNHIDEINDKPLNIKNFVEEEQKTDNVTIEDGKIFFNGMVIEPIYNDVYENYEEHIDDYDNNNVNNFDEYGNRYYQ